MSTAMTSEECVFRIGDAYKLEELLGKGAYGVVCSATHLATSRKVAIKKIAPLAHPMFALRTLREIKIMRYFRHDNIVSILDIIKPDSLDTFAEVYLVQELMETDLHRIIRSQTLTDDYCQYFTYQTLRALKCLHSANIIHRDLKPSNLLLNSNCDLKVCDFGLARTINVAAPASTCLMTEYVATRWYRAPEIMLTFKEYTQAIDLWSVGCILSEMINGKPLFPGRDYHHQLLLILEVLGKPCAEDFGAIKFDRAREYIRTLAIQKKASIAELHPHAQPLAIDLLERLLTFAPAKRISVAEALMHPYLAPYHDPADEPTAPPIPEFLFDFDNSKESLSIEELKVLLYNEIMAPEAYYGALHDESLPSAS